MGGMKELVGLLFWMDNEKMSKLKAVQSGERDLPKNKQEIIEYLRSQNKQHHHNGRLPIPKTKSNQNGQDPPRVE